MSELTEEKSAVIIGADPCIDGFNRLYVLFKRIFMKAIILTYAPVQDFEREILKQTNIFKLALNQHAVDLKPNARIITDYILPKIFDSCPEKIISVRQRLRCYSARVEYPNIEFKGSTIIAAADYLISKDYDEILIVGDNRVNSQKFSIKTVTLI
jgi:hypothetical protein